MSTFFASIKTKNELLFFFGLFCFLAGLCCLIGTKSSENQLFGVSVWLKPMKFFISTGIMAWTMAYFMHFLANQNQVSVYNISFVVLLSIELFLIVYQAFNNEPSHFNQNNDFGKVVFSVMAVTITIFMLHTAFIGSLFFLQKEFAASDVLITAIQISFIITVVFAFEGFAMGAILKHTVGATDGTEGLPIVNWSKNHGDLRIAHFFGLHALQLVPLLSVLLAKTKKEVYWIGLFYFLFVTFTLIKALQGKPFWRW
jgi:hypothetical protein